MPAIFSSARWPADGPHPTTNESRTGPDKLTRLGILVSVVVLSLAWAMLLSLRTGSERDKNDTLEYEAHYRCVAVRHDLDTCAGEIGQSFDLLYYALVRTTTLVFGERGFFCFKFLVAFIVCFSILYPSMKLSRIPLLSASIVLSDFRFLEYGANVMRHGLALAAFMLALLAASQAQPFRLLKSRFLAPGFHFSALILAITPRRRVPGWLLLSSLAITGLISTQLNVIADVLFQLGLGGDKLLFYLHGITTGEEVAGSASLLTAVPLHYTFVVLAGFAIYRRTTSSLYIYLYNLMVFVLCAFLAIHQLPVAYRLLGFMLPFIAIVAAFETDELARHFGAYRLFARQAISATAFAICVALFAKNIEFFAVHLT